VIRERILSSVLFPEPLLPINPTTSPLSISNERSFSAQKRLDFDCRAPARRDRIALTGANAHPDKESLSVWYD